jgi:hypothetical protein
LIDHFAPINGVFSTSCRFGALARERRDIPINDPLARCRKDPFKPLLGKNAEIATKAW